jgi:hypothetical protein
MTLFIHRVAHLAAASLYGLFDHPAFTPSTILNSCIPVFLKVFQQPAGAEQAKPLNEMTAEVLREPDSIGRRARMVSSRSNERLCTGGTYRAHPLV